MRFINVIWVKEGSYLVFRSLSGLARTEEFKE